MKVGLMIKKVDEFFQYWKFNNFFVLFPSFLIGRLKLTIMGLNHTTLMIPESLFVQR